MSRALSARLLAAATTGSLVLFGCDEPGEVGPDVAEIPRVEACDAVRSWSREWAANEDDVLDRIELVRERGADCGDAGKHPVAPSLREDGALRCAARAHALSMATRGFLGHVDPDGVGPDARAEAAGYAGTVVEHFAAGPRDAAALIDDLWLRAPTHCADLASRERVDIGVGHVENVDDEHGTYWVVVLGSR